MISSEWYQVIGNGSKDNDYEDKLSMKFLAGANDVLLSDCLSGVFADSVIFFGQCEYDRW